MKIKNGYIGGICPTQFEGELFDGRKLYIRFRHGRLFWGIGSTDGKACDSALTNRKWIDYAGDGGDGAIKLSTIKRLIPELDWSEAEVVNYNKEYE